MMEIKVSVWGLTAIQCLGMSFWMSRMVSGKMNYDFVPTF